VRRLDLWLLAATLVLSGCAYLVQESTARALGNPGLANRQLVWLAVGIGLMMLFAFADYRVLARFAPAIYVISGTVLLALLVLAPLRAGTRSWFVLGAYTIQPSEFARVATVLGVAALAAEYRQATLDLKMAARLAGVVGVPALLVVAQPDLGMALTFGPILLGALWLGGLPWRVWASLAALGGILLVVAWFGFLKPYQKERILTFMDAQRDVYGAGYQQRQSQIAVGSGGVTGKGLHAGTQSQLRFLPAQRTDFIFAVWAEETGFVGSLVLLGAYGLLLFRIFYVALSARDRTGAVFAGAAGFVIAVQVVVNIAMVSGVAPTTGITLPLLSWGGSSVLATGITLGIVESIWRLRYANV
jgi:rod shape determining protein RodA